MTSPCIRSDRIIFKSLIQAVLRGARRYWVFHDNRRRRQWLKPFLRNKFESQLHRARYENRTRPDHQKFSSCSHMHACTRFETAGKARLESGLRLGACGVYLLLSLTIALRSFWIRSAPMGGIQGGKFNFFEILRDDTQNFRSLCCALGSLGC